MEKTQQCRLCLNKCEDMISFTKDMIEMVDCLASVTIAEDDNLPKVCCQICSENLQLAFKMQQQIIESDSTLRMNLRTIKVEIEENKLDSSDEIMGMDAGTDDEDPLLDLNEIIEIGKKQSTTNASSKDSKPLTKKRAKEQRSLKCEDCDITFENYKLMYLHSLKHKLTYCTICNTSIRTDNFKKHFENHTAPPEICEICGKTVKNKESLRGHMFHVHRENARSFKCEECNKVFKVRYRYNLHVQKAHTGVRNHVCEVCGKAFFTVYETRKHREMTHLKMRPCVCPYCNRGYSSRYALKTHMRQHTQETPYRCEICAAGFRQKVSLKTHLKSKHNIKNMTENIKIESENV